MKLKTKGIWFRMVLNLFYFQTLFLLFPTIISFSQDNNQKRKVITIDDLTKQPDKAFPFDEPFTIVYNYNKELKVKGVSYARVKFKGRKIIEEGVLPQLNFHTESAKEGSNKSNLHIFMPPLPPNNAFDILIYYDYNLEVVKKIEDLNRIYRKLNDNGKAFLKQYLILEKSLNNKNDTVLITPIQSILIKGLINFSNEYTKDLSKDKKIELFWEVCDSYSKKEKKALKKHKNGIEKLIPLINKKGEGLEFLIKFNEALLEYEITNRLMDFPNVKEIKSKLDIFNKKKERGLNINNLTKEIEGFNTCCTDLKSELAKDSLFPRIYFKTLFRLSELVNNKIDLDTIIKGYLPFFRQKEIKSEKYLFSRIRNLEETGELLWQLSQELKKSDFCKKIECGNQSFINGLDFLIESVIGQKSNLEDKFDLFKLFYFEWINGESSANSYKASVNNVIKSDIGVAHIYSNYKQTVRPYYGISINFRSVNNTNRYRELTSTSDYFKKKKFIDWNWFRYHMSIDLGASLGSIAEPNIREDLYSNSNLLLGLSLRLPRTGIRLSGGTLLHQKINSNPLLDDTKIGFLPYWSMKFDLTIREAVGSITTLLFK